MSRACLLEGKPPYRLCVQDKEPFRKVGDSARNDYEKGMPAEHTLFQVKSLALIANARKYLQILHHDSSLPRSNAV